MSATDLLISNISNWYARKDVLITGASGFMGKILLEKLLRSCPNVRNIFLIIRPKQGVSPKDRINKLIMNSLFDKVRNKNAAIFDKIIIIEGDISKPNLAISQADYETLIKNVSMVIHSAASVKFDEPLKYAIAMNVTGTELLLQMCHKMKRLEAFVYVSTAYSNCNIFEIEEKVYPPPIPLDKLFQELASLDDENLVQLKQSIINDRPNLYSVTKALAEYVVLQHNGKLPLAIVRPSIVACALQDPVEGWVDNLNGGTGIIMSIGKGILRSLMLDEKCTADIVPVDLSINMILAAGWKLSQTKTKQLAVYNYTSGGINPITWGKFERLAEKYFIKYALTGTLWYPSAYLQTNKMYHKMCVFLLHVIPAYILDLTMIATSRKPIMVKMQKQINAAINVMEYFTTHSWNFHTQNVDDLFASLSEIDKRVFNFDLKSVNWEHYMENYCKGVRKYVLKDDVDTLPEARSRLNKLKVMHNGTKFLLIMLIVVVLYYIFLFI